VTTLKVNHLSLGIFAGGIALGAALAVWLPPKFANETEQRWSKDQGEDANHKRIMALQKTLESLDSPKDAATLKQRIELQLKIEELTIQSRAAQYAGFAPFASLSSTLGTLLTALIGFAGGWFGKKHRAVASAPPPAST
jgi:hypothetical protein